MSELTADPTVDALAAAELKHTVRRSTLALAVAQAASQVVSLVGMTILLRLLAPADYGVIGMIVPLAFFLRLFTTLGLNVATVQRPELRPEETSAMFWLNLLFGVATAVLMLLLAPQLGWLYAQPASATVLRDVGLAMAATSIVAALGAQHQALMERSLRIGALGVIRIVAQLTAAALAIAAALADWGVWALVVQQYTELAMLTILVWCAEPWRPSWPRRGAAIADHLRLGGYFAAASIVFYAADNMDRILVGRLVGPEAVGLYGQAYNVMIKPVYLTVTPLLALALSSLSRASEQPETRRQLALGYYRLLAVVLLPASAGLAVVGTDVMRLLGGEAWSTAGPLLSVLGIGMFGQAMVIVGGPILTAAGRADRLFAAAVVVAAVLCAAYLIGWWCGLQYGEPVLGVAWGYAVAILGVIALPYSWFCWKTAGYRLGELGPLFARVLLYTLGMAGIVLAANRGLTARGVDSPLVRVLVQVPLGMVVYAILARRELAWFVGQLRQMRRMRDGEKS